MGGYSWPASLPPALGIYVEWVDSRSYQAAILGDAKIRARRSYLRQCEPLCARLSPSFFFPEAKSAHARSKMSKGKIFRS
jgi:hypothetical protein